MEPTAASRDRLASNPFKSRTPAHHLVQGSDLLRQGGKVARHTIDSRPIHPFQLIHKHLKF